MMLTTIDNPYDPRTSWNDWLSYDHSAGHFTCERLANEAAISYDLSDELEEQEIARAINEIVSNDPNYYVLE